MSELDDALFRGARYNNSAYHPEANEYGHTGKGGTLANWVRSIKDVVTMTRYVRDTYDAIADAARTVTGGALAFVAPHFTGLTAIGSRWSGGGGLGQGEALLLSPASASAAGSTVKIAVANSGASDGSPNILLAGIEGPALAGAAFLDTLSQGVASPTPLDLRASGTRRLRLADGQPVQVTGGASFGGWTHAGAVVGLVADTSSSIGACVVIGSATGTAPYIGAAASAATALSLGTNGAATVRVSASAVYPAADGAMTLGTSTYRCSTLYAVTGAINTSDARQKVIRGSLTDPERAAARRLAGMVQIFQWAAVAADKGRAGARLHAGWIAQEVEAAFRSEGLDPARYALWCADPAMEEVEETVEVPVPVTEQRTLEVPRVEIRDGRAVVVTRVETQEVPVIDHLPLELEDGTPLLDDDGEPRFHAVPRTAITLQARKVLRPVTDAAGAPVMQLGLRHDQLLAFVLAGMAAP